MSTGYTLKRDPLTPDGGTQWMGWFATEEEAYEYLLAWEDKNRLSGLSGWQVVPASKAHA